MFNFNRKEKGQGLVEYALILVLIAIVVIVAMTTLGNKVSGTFDSVNSGLGADGSGGGAAAQPTANPAEVSFSCPDGNGYRVTYWNTAIGNWSLLSTSTCSGGTASYDASALPSGTYLVVEDTVTWLRLYEGPTP